MRYISWLAPIACLFLVACTATQGGARLYPVDGASTGVAFPGIINSAGADQPARRFIFNIHGMGCTKRDYNEVLITSLEPYGFGRRETLASSITLARASSQDEDPSRESAPDDDVDCDGDPDRETPPDTTGWYDLPLTESVDVRGEGLDCSVDGDDPPCRYTTFGSLRVDRLTTADASEELFVYTYFLNDDFWALQREYLTGDLRPDGRALINSALKGEVMDRGFSDAVGYLGRMGDLARQSIRTSVCLMLQHAATNELSLTLEADASCLSRAPRTLSSEVEFSFISHSLGSRMLFDALSAEPSSGAQHQESSDERAAVRALAERTRVVYMAANQMPLLGIGGVRFDEDPSSHEPNADPCRSLTFVYCRDRDPPLHIVGFYDPDDLLGFRADSGMSPREMQRASTSGLRFINVRHRNATQWVWTLAWPPSAHDQELHRESSRRLIFCGAVADDAGRLTPRIQGCRRRS